MSPTHPVRACLDCSKLQRAVREAQELLGHRDVNTTMIYTQVLNRGPAGVQSPADRMTAL